MRYCKIVLKNFGSNIAHYVCGDEKRLVEW